MIRQFSIGQPVTRADYSVPLWVGCVLAVYEGQDGVRYAVARDWGKTRHYLANELQAVKQKPVLRVFINNLQPKGAINEKTISAGHDRSKC